MAYAHKPYGLLGEIIDMQKLQKDYERMKSRM